MIELSFNKSRWELQTLRNSKVTKKYQWKLEKQGISRYCFHQGICCFRNRKYLLFSRLELRLSFCHLNRLSIELPKATVAVFATVALAADFPALETIYVAYTTCTFLKAAEKRATKNENLVLQNCCKTSSIAMLRVLPPMFKPVNKLICCKRGLMWVEKRATSLFNSFYSKVAKQVARFLLLVLPHLYHRTCIKYLKSFSAWQQTAFFWKRKGGEVVRAVASH